MGVPSFYRWMVGKYPKVVTNAIEEEEADCDYDMPNPNGMEFDNLYLDMNGIIHPCFHPDELLPPTTSDEVFIAIFEYIDRIFRIVRPRKLLYMAIDGVAPRAKMNQQRSRRFRTAKDAEVAEAEEERIRKEFERIGKEVLPRQISEVSDSNLITPGTVFMEKVAKALEYYIRLRLSGHPGWKSIEVILSDASVPGEGEHKIMNFIRLQRNLSGYNPNKRHCLYGLDADLIMLALASHEIHFSILREDLLMQESQDNAMISFEASSRKEYDMVKSRQWFRKIHTSNGACSTPKKPYQFVNIWTLRECLEIDMRIPNPPFAIDFERIVDDFIFICFFTGNDFLPHLPSIEIHEGAIDLLIAVYKQTFKMMGGYLVDTRRIKESKAEYITVKRVEKFIHEVGTFEELIFEKRYKLWEKKLQRLLQQRLNEEETSGNHYDNFDDHNSQEYPNVRSHTKASDNQSVKLKEGSAFKGSKTISDCMSEKCNISTSGSTKIGRPEESVVLQNTKELMQKLKDFLRNKSDLFKDGVVQNDKIRLGCPGWKDRYYREKFSSENPSQMENTRKNIVEKYVEGLCWVLHYYFAGVCSWTWYYPFYYSPFASDLKRLSFPKAGFKIGLPFKPFDQLMAVLPPRSSNALPKAYRVLMTHEDSPILKFYPPDFLVDTHGKRYMWQGVCQLPFIEEELLVCATNMLERDLEVDDVERNAYKHDKIFVRHSHALGMKIISLNKSSENACRRKEEKWRIDAARGEIHGFLSPYDDNLGNHCFTSPIKEMEDITEDHAICAIYRNPDSHDHIPRLLENVTMPEKTVTEADIVERKLWHEYYGSQPTQTICPQRNAQRIEAARNQAQPWSPREMVVTAGSGWGGAGRGNAQRIGAATRPVPPSSARGACIGASWSNPGNLGRRNFDIRSDTYSRGAGSGGRRNHYQSRNDGFGQSARGSVVGRSENWRQSWTPVAGGGGGNWSYSNQRWIARHNNTYPLDEGTGRGSMR